MLTAIIDTCGQCLQHFGVVEGHHPQKDGFNRCPHCMAIGLDKERAKPQLPVLAVTLRNDHKLKYQSVDALVEHTQTLSVDGGGALGTISYDFTGWGPDASTAIANLKTLVNMAGITDLSYDQAEAAAIDLEVAKQKELQRF